MVRALRAFAWVGMSLLAAALMFSLAVLGIELTRQGGRIATVWLANGAIIALLLRQTRARWPALLVASTSGNVIAGLVVGDTAGLAVGLALCNLLEIAVIAHFMAPHVARNAFFGSRAQLGWLGLFTLLGPMLSTPAAGLVISLSGKVPDADPLFHWAAADALGIMMVTPLLLAFSGPRPQRGARGNVEFALMLILAVAVAGRIFTHPAAFVFLVMPLLLLAGLRLTLDRAALIVAVVCTIAVALTIADLGPIGAASATPSLRNYLIQAFVATAIMMTLPISALSIEWEKAWRRCACGKNNSACSPTMAAISSCGSTAMATPGSFPRRPNACSASPPTNCTVRPCSTVSPPRTGRTSSPPSMTRGGSARRRPAFGCAPRVVKAAGSRPVSVSRPSRRHLRSLACARKRGLVARSPMPPPRSLQSTSSAPSATSTSGASPKGSPRRARRASASPIGCC